MALGTVNLFRMVLLADARDMTTHLTSAGKKLKTYSNLFQPKQGAPHGQAVFIPAADDDRPGEGNTSRRLRQTGRQPSPRNCIRRTRPLHVNSFVFLAKEGFLRRCDFSHRVIPGFMIQGGDPTGTGTGGPGYKVKAEFNSRKAHARACCQPARSSDPQFRGARSFFVMHDCRPAP